MATKKSDGAGGQKGTRATKTTTTTAENNAAGAAGGASAGSTGAAKTGGAAANTGGAKKTGTTAAKTGGTASKSGAAKKTAGAGGGARGASKSRGPELRRDLRDFASGRPEGWSHEDWLGFLDHLQQRGHNINDRDQIGAMLERERLSIALERVEGLDAQQVDSIADRYGYLWRLRNADADEIAREANVPHDVAHRVVEAVRR